MIRKLAPALVVLALAAAPAYAQPGNAPAAATPRQPGPQSLALASELLRAAQVEESVYRGFELGMRQGAGDAAPPELLAMVREEFRREFKWAEVEPQIAALYAGLFTDEELRALIGWHQTPAGRRAAELSPELSVGSQAIMMPLMQRVLPQVMRRAQEMGEAAARAPGSR